MTINFYRMLVLAGMTLLVAVNLSQTAFADDCEIEHVRSDRWLPAIKGKSDIEAFQLLKSCAEAGNFVAQWEVGIRYKLGKGTLESNKEAMRWMLMAAESGDSRYQVKVARRYASGIDPFSKDTIRAYMWFNLAAAQGSVSAQTAKIYMREGSLNYDKITPAQIEKAQELSVRCLEQNYKDC